MYVIFAVGNQEIIDDYPAIEEADIFACLLFASQLTKIKYERHIGKQE